MRCQVSSQSKWNSSNLSSVLTLFCLNSSQKMIWWRNSNTQCYKRTAQQKLLRFLIMNNKQTINSSSLTLSTPTCSNFSVSLCLVRNRNCMWAFSGLPMLFFRIVAIILVSVLATIAIAFWKYLAWSSSPHDKVLAKMLLALVPRKLPSNDENLIGER